MEVPSGLDEGTWSMGEGRDGTQQDGDRDRVEWKGKERERQGKEQVMYK